jgi:hypothetical protein
MTSPVAVSLPAISLNVMLPLRPLSTLEYSPNHSPASCETSVSYPTMGTGAWYPPQAMRNATVVTAERVEAILIAGLKGGRVELLDASDRRKVAGRS